MEIEAINDVRIKPADPRNMVLARVHVEDNNIIVDYPARNDTFYDLIKVKLGYRWDTARWVKAVDKYSGPIRDRIVETACEMLNKNFCVQISAEYIEDIKAGDYSPEQTRWIKAVTSGRNEGKLAVCYNWPGEDFFKELKKIDGFEFDKPHKLFRPENFVALEEFAEVYNFKFSEKAWELVEAEKRKWDEAVEVERIQLVSKNKDVIDIEVAISEEIPDELLDED
ncbi:MAG: hypothetical protein ACOCXH_04430 [Cyclobacteriaceae bacterium]